MCLGEVILRSGGVGGAIRGGAGVAFQQNVLTQKKSKFVCYLNDYLIYPIFAET